MSTNKYLPHVLVLPEDDANREIANGFHLHVENYQQMQVLPIAGGWGRLLDEFTSTHVREMGRFPKRYMVLLLDFDDAPNRLEQVKNRIPSDLVGRVVILGAQTNPEDLKRAGLGTFEHIGSALAIECRDGHDEIWRHPLVRHNASELKRLRDDIRQILF